MSDREDHAHPPHGPVPPPCQPPESPHPAPQHEGWHPVPRRNSLIVFIGRWRWTISAILGLAILITLMFLEHLWALLACLVLTVILLILQFRGRDRDAR